MHRHYAEMDHNHDEIRHSHHGHPTRKAPQKAYYSDNPILANHIYAPSTMGHR
jgi:hypothetical protein